MKSESGMLLLALTFGFVLICTWLILKYEKSDIGVANATIAGKWCLDGQNLVLNINDDMTYSLLTKDSSYNINGIGRSWTILNSYSGQEITLKKFKKRPSVEGNEYVDWHMPITVSNNGLIILFGTEPERFLRKCN